MKRWCWAISWPRSQVSDFASWLGRVVIAAASASATASAWWSPRGSPTSIRNRVLRSTRVATGLMFLPKTRSPSQCPGTARSSTSAGRSEMCSVFGPTAAAVGQPDTFGASDHPTGAQIPGQLLAQRAARLHEQGAVDALVRHLHLRTRRVGQLQPAIDLLRRPSTGSASPPRWHAAPGCRPACTASAGSPATTPRGRPAQPDTAAGHRWR